MLLQQKGVDLVVTSLLRISPAKARSVSGNALIFSSKPPMTLCSLFNCACSEATVFFNTVRICAPNALISWRAP
jgi:hypothetical protein